MTTERPDNIQAAEVLLPSTDLAADLGYYTETLGFRLDTIFPADDPAVATLSGYGVRIRLERGSEVPPGVLRLLCGDPDAVAAGRPELVAPGGVQDSARRRRPADRTAATRHAFVVRRLKDDTPWVIGRAGMAYRDLIPGRLGGSIIASHIRIPDAGPVPDMVHYHAVGFQLIFCYSGWVRLVYEDQGPPFVLGAGDCVIQPPRIRHRVLEASEQLQVIEIGVPADHVTTVDHEMTLPTPVREPGRGSSAGRCSATAWRPRRSGRGGGWPGSRRARPASASDRRGAPRSRSRARIGSDARAGDQPHLGHPVRVRARRGR